MKPPDIQKKSFLFSNDQLANNLPNIAAMQNEQENNLAALNGEKFPLWVWLLPLCGSVDLAAYSSFFLVNLPAADWAAMLADNAVLPFMVGGQGISCAFLGMALILTAKTALIKRWRSYQRFLFFNAVGFVLLGLVPPLIFLPDRNNSDFGFGVALMPIFFYPIFNVARLFILFLVSIASMRFARLP